jgi:DNA-binding winged helix-turn-helix (wHTH) protein
MDLLFSRMDDPSLVFRFDDFVVNAKDRIVSRNGETVHLTPKVFDTLLAFLERTGKTIAKEELMTAVWTQRFVDESNLTQNVAVLRKALGDNGKDRRFIVTVPSRGYRFVPNVERGDLSYPLPHPERYGEKTVTAVEGRRENRPRSLWILLILLAATALVTAVVTYALSDRGQ